MLKRLCALRRWRPHRPLLPSLALIVALCFAFAEPLACILHCQLYVPWLLRNQHHHAHTQPANVHTALGGWAAPVQGHTLAAAAPADAAQWCVYAARQPLAPGVLVPPSPIHELVLVLALSLGALARLLFLPWREPQLHPAGGIAPPTPPPRQVFLLHSPAR